MTTVVARPGDRGSAVVELVIATPLLFLLLGFALVVGRMGSVSGDVEQAARDAARAASLRSTPALAFRDATSAADQSLDNSDSRCASVAVAISPDLRPDGSVTVTVSCTVSLREVFPLAPGSKTVAASVDVPVDRWRAG